jgi:hypothetical protein
MFILQSLCLEIKKSIKTNRLDLTTGKMESILGKKVLVRGTKVDIPAMIWPHLNNSGTPLVIITKINFQCKSIRELVLC